MCRASAISSPVRTSMRVGGEVEVAGLDVDGARVRGRRTAGLPRDLAGLDVAAAARGQHECGGDRGHDRARSAPKGTRGTLPIPGCGLRHRVARAAWPGRGRRPGPAAAPRSCRAALPAARSRPRRPHARSPRARAHRRGVGARSAASRQEVFDATPSASRSRTRSASGPTRTVVERMPVPSSSIESEWARASSPAFVAVYVAIRGRAWRRRVGRDEHEIAARVRDRSSTRSRAGTSGSARARFVATSCVSRSTAMSVEPARGTRRRRCSRGRRPARVPARSPRRTPRSIPGPTRRAGGRTASPPASTTLAAVSARRSARRAPIATLHPESPELRGDRDADARGRAGDDRRPRFAAVVHALLHSESSSPPQATTSPAASMSRRVSPRSTGTSTVDAPLVASARPGASRWSSASSSSPVPPQTTTTTSEGSVPSPRAPHPPRRRRPAVVTAIAGRPAWAASRAMRTGARRLAVGGHDDAARLSPAPVPASGTCAPPTGRRRRARRRRDRRPGARPRGRRPHGPDAAAPCRRRTPAARRRRVAGTARSAVSTSRGRGRRARRGRSARPRRPAPSANRRGATRRSSSPVATIASASAKPRSSKSRAWRPQVPRWCGLSQLKTPFAPQVFATPRFPASAKARSPSTAPVVDHARPRQHDDPAVDAVDLVDVDRTCTRHAGMVARRAGSRREPFCEPLACRP